MSENNSFNVRLAATMRERAETLTARWLELLKDRLEDIPRRRIFPSASLLNHIPIVLGSMADFVADEKGDVRTSFVVDDLMQLARLRRRQGYDLGEIEREFSILASLLFETAREVAEQEPKPPSSELIAVMQKLHEALRMVTATTSQSYGRAALEDRQERAQALERFGEVIAHEMRNRLNFAHLTLAGWGKEETPKDGDSLVGAMQAALGVLRDLADDVHALALSQASEEASWARRRPLAEVVEAVVESARPLAESRQASLELASEPPQAAVDATRLELALVNLIINSLRHGRPDDVDSLTVEVSTERLASDDGWAIMVKDNGAGIPEELQRHVFEAGFQGPTAESFGSGLGLSIARTAAEQMGGLLQLESSPEGTTFRLIVPDPPEE